MNPGAAVDCERILDGFLAQPVNALTSLAFVVVAVVVGVRGSRPWVAVGLAAVGVGSFLFHGPIPPGAQWAHDVSLAWLLLVAAASGTGWDRQAGWGGLVVLGGLIGVWPETADPLGVALAAVAIVSIMWRYPTRRTAVAILLLSISAVVGRLSATGGPWCQPESLLQGHGLWHLGAAAAVTWWATSSREPPGHGGAGGRRQPQLRSG